MLPEDLDILYTISRDAYSLNFGHHWEEGGLEAYMNKVFGREVLATELVAPAIHYYVAFVDKKPVAFMKLNLHSNLPGADPEKGIELTSSIFYLIIKDLGSDASSLSWHSGWRRRRERKPSGWR